MTDKDKKSERPVNPEQLFQLIEQADRMIVKLEPFENSELLYESNKKEDLNALRQSLTMEVPEEWFHCMCMGAPAIYIYRGDEELVLLTNHHGYSIRCSLWDSDAAITDCEKWLSWFDERGIKQPRMEVEELSAQREQFKKDWNKWIVAMPEALRPIWEDSIGEMDIVDTKPLRQALQSSIPDKEERIRALLSWFGSGAGPWSGFPAYEAGAEELLLDYEITEIVGAIIDSKLTNEQIEGAARLFGGWSFSKKHPAGIDLVPKDLKKTFWKHVKHTKDKDKLARAKNAFK